MTKEHRLRTWIRHPPRVSRAVVLGVFGAVVIGGGALAIRSTSQDQAWQLRVPAFVEEPASAGIEHVYDGEWSFFVGGGVAVFDCNQDGRPDLYVAGGANPASLFRNDSAVGGNLHFKDITDPATALGEVTGAYPIDIDSDDTVDIAVLRHGENVLLRGLGDCRFERANEAWGFDGGDVWTTAFSAKWEPGADMPTLAFGNYVALGPGGERTGACTANSLVRPDAGRYTNVTPLDPGWCTLSMLFSDWDRSGRIDLRVSNDRQYYREGEEQMWKITPDEPPRLYTAADGWESMQIWGMGIASHDLTGDGRPEAFLTSMGDNKLQTLADGADSPTYVDIALSRGVTAHRPHTGDDVLPSTAWHPEFRDVNNDGHIDLFISKGNVDAMVEAATEDPSNLLLGRPDGTFVESAPDAGIMSLSRGRGAAVADFNLDGMLDVVEVNRRDNVRVWRNVGWGDADHPPSMSNWIALQIEQPGTNSNAIGAWVEVKAGGDTMRHEVTIGGGHGGGQLGWLHFGLGQADAAEVRVVWPDGEIGQWLPVASNQFVTIARDGDAAQPWKPVTGGSN